MTMNTQHPWRSIDWRQRGQAQAGIWGSLYARRVSTAVWNGSRLSIASTLCVFTSHLNIRSTILAGVKSAMVKPCCSIGLTSSAMSRWAGGSAPVPRRADGQPLGRVLIGPVNTALIGLAEKSSLPLRIMRPMARACRSPLITSGTRSPTAAIGLLEPAGLPIGLGLCARELAVGPQHVRIPFAPFAGGPAGRIGRDMHHMGDLACRGASLEPLLDFEIEIDGARAGERLGAPNVVQQNLGKPPVADP